MVVYNRRGYNQNGNVVVAPIVSVTVNRVGWPYALNVGAPNSASYNGGSMAQTATGSASMTATPTVLVGISTAPTPRFGALNSATYNHLPLNGSYTLSSSGGVGAMSAVLGATSVSVMATLSGSSVLGGSGSAPELNMMGGFASAPLGNSPLSDAYVNASSGSGALVALLTGPVAIAATVAGLAVVELLLADELTAASFDVLVVVPDPLEVVLVRQA